MDALWMLAASLFFASMAVCVKFASAWFNASELVFWRGLLGMAVMGLWARSRRTSLATRYPLMHAWRSLVGVLSLGAWFYAIAGLPLATAMTLNYMSSVWIAAFLVGGALVAWNPRAGTAVITRQGPLALTVLAGFAGVVLMLRPTIGSHQVFAGLVGLLSGVLAAFAYLQVMALGRIGEPEVRTVFYFAAGSAVAGAIGMTLTGVSAWDWGHAAWLLHDPRVQPRRDAAGREPAVLRHRVRGLVQPGPVRRPHRARRLGRHGADLRQRHRGHGPALARGAGCAGGGALTRLSVRR
jgi:drug/metabolite transporter (DMT)-like permease